jgi:hypothetical protein
MAYLFEEGLREMNVQNPPINRHDVAIAVGIDSASPDY